MDDISKYGLDLHCEMIIEEYRANLDIFRKMDEIVSGAAAGILKNSGIVVTALESRIKSEESLAGKLKTKGYKYNTLSDLTDILGARIITFYTDDIDKVSALVDKIFEIDWTNSVDKRKMYELNSFGYMSLHYICRIPKSLYSDPEHPEINEYRFEVQMRTALQHVWANLYHDTGYKSGIEVPKEHLRTLNRLAGMLELADDEFSRIRTSIHDYRRKIEKLVKSGNFEDIKLNGDTLRSYAEIRPFDKLMTRIASINQAEILQAPMMPYLGAFIKMGFDNLKDIDELIRNYSEDAYQLALSEIGGTDIDILSSSVAVQDLCIVYLVRNGGSEKELTEFFDTINGENAYNKDRAKRVMEKVSHLPFMKQQNDSKI